MNEEREKALGVVIDALSYLGGALADLGMENEFRVAVSRKDFTKLRRLRHGNSVFHDAGGNFVQIAGVDFGVDQDRQNG